MSSRRIIISCEQEAFLTAQSTLTKWAGLTLTERCGKFKEHFRDTKLNVYKLRQIYKKHGIKRKTIQMKKVPQKGSYTDPR